MTAFQVLSSAAVAFVIARAGVFAWLRKGPTGWVEFVSCPLCVGFWVGFGLGVTRLYLGKTLDFSDAFDLVAGGALVGAVALLYACVIDFLDALEQAAKRVFAVTTSKLEPSPERLGDPKPELGIPVKPQGPDVVVVAEGDPWPKNPPKRP